MLATELEVREHDQGFTFWTGKQLPLTGSYSNIQSCEASTSSSVATSCFEVQTWSIEADPAFKGCDIWLNEIIHGSLDFQLLMPITYQRSGRLEIAMDNKTTPMQAEPSGATHRRTSSGISEDAAQSAHEFMSGTIRRSSSGVTDDAAKLARDFVRSSKETGPGLTDDLTDKAHRFIDGTATHQTSHSKHLPDVTTPGMTDEIVEEALEFTDGIRKGGK